jgi:hypothetical protein
MERAARSDKSGNGWGHRARSAAAWVAFCTFAGAVFGQSMDTGWPTVLRFALIGACGGFVVGLFKFISLMGRTRPERIAKWIIVALFAQFVCMAWWSVTYCCPDPAPPPRPVAPVPGGPFAEPLYELNIREKTRNARSDPRIESIPGTSVERRKGVRNLLKRFLTPFLRPARR